MGILIGIARWIVNTLFVLAIAAFLIASTGAHFTEKDNLKPIVQEVAISQLNAVQVQDLKNNLNDACEEQNTETISQYSKEINQTITINCSQISDEYVKQIYRDQVIGSMFDNIYSQKCSGFSCLFGNPLAAASESANKFMRKLEYICIIGTLILGALVFLMAKGISGRLIALGYPVLFSGIPYFFMPAVRGKVIASLPSNAGPSGAKIVDLILEYLGSMFIIMFAIGAVLVAAGFIIKFTIERKRKKK